MCILINSKVQKERGVNKKGNCARKKVILRGCHANTECGEHHHNLPCTVLTIAELE